MLPAAAARLLVAPVFGVTVGPASLDGYGPDAGVRDADETGAATAIRRTFAAGAGAATVIAGTWISFGALCVTTVVVVCTVTVRGTITVAGALAGADGRIVEAGAGALI